MKPNGKIDRIFISGPMSGVLDYKERFNKVHEWLRDRGYSVYNPAWLEFDLGTSWSRKEMLAMDINAISHCDAIVLLPGKCTGGWFELHYAVITGMPIFQFDFDTMSMKNIVDTERVILEMAFEVTNND